MADPVTPEGNFESRKQQPPPLSDRVFGLRASLLNLAISTGHVFRRWKTVHTLMLEKKPNWPYIEKLRVIHLVESDFNLLVGILFGRRTLTQAERLSTLGEANAGFRADRNAEEMHLQKHLLYGISRLTRTSATSFNNDCTACFDRIVLTLPSLLAQRLGLSPEPCELVLKTFLEC